MTLERKDKATGATIPNIIHLIWFGSWPPPPAYLENIRLWKQLNPGYTVNLWTDESLLEKSACKAMREFCDKNTLELSDIQKLPKDYPNIQAVRDWLHFEEAGKPRFAAASDVLRVSLLEIQGGHYFDCDIKPLATISDVDWQCPEGSYQLVNELDRNSGAIRCDQYEYCVMGAVPHNNLYQNANLIYQNTHPEVMQSLSEAFRSDPNIDRVRCVMEATGRVLSFASKTKVDQPRLEFRGDSRNEAIHENIEEGYLKGKINIKFDRSYGVESPDISSQTKFILGGLEQVFKRAKSTLRARRAVVPSLPVGQLFEKTNNENKVLLYKALNGELAIKCPSPQNCQTILDILKGYGLDAFFESKKGVVYIKQTKGMDACGTYQAKNGELALKFPTEETAKNFIKLFSLDNIKLTHRNGVIYFPISFNEPRANLQTEFKSPPPQTAPSYRK